MQGNLSIERMCQLAAVSRTGFYRSLQTRNRSKRIWKCGIDDPEDSRRAQAALRLSTGERGTATARVCQ